MSSDKTANEQARETDGKETGTVKEAGKKKLDKTAEEAVLAARYPDQKIVKGSLRDAGETDGFGNKRTVEIVCQGDGKTKRRIATSDLHQVKYCESWIKKVRLDRRKEQRLNSDNKTEPRGPKKGQKTGPKTGRKSEKADQTEKAPRGRKKAIAKKS